MKKVLFFHHGSISVGAGLCALHILQNIDRKKYQVTVCIPRQPGDLKEKIENLGIQVRTDISKSYSYMHINGFNWNFFSPWHLKNINDVRGYAKTVQLIIEEEKPDVVMVNSMTLFWIGVIAKKYNAKTVCFHRETYVRGLFGIRTAQIKKVLNRDFDEIVFISNYDLEQTGNEKYKYRRITDKVDETLYNRLDKETCRKNLNLPTGKLILYTGGASEFKGIFVLLGVMKYLQTDAKAVILQYSKPVEKNEKRLKNVVKEFLGLNIERKVWKYIDKNGLEERLVLCGRTDHVEEYFMACDLVVFPSQSAHQARPIYEAGIAKCPIIVSDFINTAEFLDSNNGWTVKHNDVKAWAECIDDVLQNRTNVKARVETNYEKVIMNNNYINLKKEVNELLEGITKD